MCIFVCKLRHHFPDSKHIRGFVRHEIFGNFIRHSEIFGLHPQLFIIATNRYNPPYSGGSDVSIFPAIGRHLRRYAYVHVSTCIYVDMCRYAWIRISTCIYAYLRVSTRACHHFPEIWWLEYKIEPMWDICYSQETKQDEVFKIARSNLR
jgi:hypothetical protein